MIKDLYERINSKNYVVFDLESNGLLDDVTVLHCAWVYCASSDSYELFRTAAFFVLAYSHSLFIQQKPPLTQSIKSGLNDNVG